MHADPFCILVRIIGGVDYKGVREIMKAAIERLQTLSPGEIESVVSPQLSIVKVRAPLVTLLRA